MTDGGRPGGEHPRDAWQRELDPEMMAGRNYDLEGPHPEKQNPPTAYDLKGLHRRLDEFTDDELQRIPVLPAGSRLEQGATYLDLGESHPREFTATAGMEAGPDNRYVPKTEVGYPLWNRLLGVRNPARLDPADAGSGTG
jgi:hypothetical protein